MLLIILVSSLQCVYGLIGYDCGGQHLNITTVSLLGTSECDLGYQKPNSSHVYVQLFQLSEYNYAEIYQCKIELFRTVQYCGMHSHISAVSNGRMEYFLEISPSKCSRAIQDSIFSLGTGGEINGLKPNSTNTHSFMLAGTVGYDGRCEGTQYSDPYGTWNNVIVDALIQITLKTAYVLLNLNSGKIMLKSGTVCDLTRGTCVDSEDGHTFWKPMPTSSCNFHQYDVLYEGLATKLISQAEDSTYATVYSLVTQDLTFALTAAHQQSLCGYTLHNTEHPKLFILETVKGNTFTHRGSIHVGNLDIFTYVNSKFVYVEKHIKQQMTSLYHNVMQHRCELEREVIKNTLSFAFLQPDEFDIA
ncbi:hypothetical protein PUN28_012868 [Cardiocondyla obscurior]|uniref:Uncharacterized protein n=1 Tax=Cardiocondyla obscurior TaxID=286306 RepID=A0AAW2F5S0_9HYME